VDDAAQRHGEDDQGDRRRLLTRVLVLGAPGQLGSDCVEAFAADAAVGLGHDDLDITDTGAVRATLERLRPDVVVNTAAFHNVPKCETTPDLAFAANAIAPLELARACTDLGARLVHVSTDYVFDGAKRAPYVEDDRPAPLNVYGISKVAGEHGVLADGRHQVVRSSGLYGLRPCRAKGGNFIDTMFRVAAEKPEVRVVDDEVLTPTFTADLAAQIRVLALDGPPGLYHVTAGGACSWYEFARAIFELGGLTTPLSPSSSDGNPGPVRRPAYSVLDNAALARLGLDRMRPWREALADYMGQRLSATGGATSGARGEHATNGSQQTAGTRVPADTR
jgi:dTDP-4-dehydrorhamnose reductase